MTAWRTASLQWRLTLSLLLVISLVWTLVLCMTWFKTEHELNELLDAHLAQTAAVLVAQTHDEHDDDFTTAAVLHKYQQRVAFQIWHEQELIQRSSEAPASPLAPWGQSGISEQQHAGDLWRVFATAGRESDVWILVAERQSARNDILHAGLQSAIVPMLLALPVLALLIGGTIYQSLAPLRRLSQSVARRHPDALKPLSDPLTAEVRPLVRALNRLFEQMTRQMDGERRFTADAAHELRTPIAAIRMQAQVARGAQQDPERQVALEAVLQACDRATRLVAQLLQLARLDADSATLNEEGCDAVIETQAILAELGPQAVSKQQTLSLDAPATLPLAMPPEWVGVLVGNLVDNAERYSPAGAHIQVAWLSSGSAPQLVVQDSGPGLSDTDLARLGDRFFRVPGNGAPGSGLGWSIVQRLAERYHLHLAVDRSLALGGLRVQLTWPETLPEEAAPQP